MRSIGSIFCTLLLGLNLLFSSYTSYNVEIGNNDTNLRLIQKDTVGGILSLAASLANLPKDQWNDNQLKLIIQKIKKDHDLEIYPLDSNRVAGRIYVEILKPIDTSIIIGSILLSNNMHEILRVKDVEQYFGKKIEPLGFLKYAKNPSPVRLTLSDSVSFLLSLNSRKEIQDSFVIQLKVVKGKYLDR